MSHEDLINKLQEKSTESFHDAIQNDPELKKQAKLLWLDELLDEKNSSWLDKFPRMTMIFFMDALRERDFQTMKTLLPRLFQMRETLYEQYLEVIANDYLWPDHYKISQLSTMIDNCQKDLIHLGPSSNEEAWLLVMFALLKPMADMLPMCSSPCVMNTTDLTFNEAQSFYTAEAFNKCKEQLDYSKEHIAKLACDYFIDDITQIKSAIEAEEEVKWLQECMQIQNIVFNILNVFAWLPLLLTNIKRMYDGQPLRLYHYVGSEYNEMLNQKMIANLVISSDHKKISNPSHCAYGADIEATQSYQCPTRSDHSHVIQKNALPESQYIMFGSKQSRKNLNKRNSIFTVLHHNGDRKLHFIMEHESKKKYPKGTFSLKVKKGFAKKEETHPTYAIKIYKKNTISELRSAMRAAYCYQQLGRTGITFRRNNKQYMVTDWLQGSQLDKANEAQIQSIPIDRRIKMAISLLEELSLFHRKGFIHQNIKPSNVIINIEKEKLNFVDLDSVRPKEASSDPVMYTKSYLSSNTQRNAQINPSMKLLNEQTDLHAMGLTLSFLFKEICTLDLKQIVISEKNSGTSIEDVLDFFVLKFDLATSLAYPKLVKLLKNMEDSDSLQWSVDQYIQAFNDVLLAECQNEKNLTKNNLRSLNSKSVSNEELRSSSTLSSENLSSMSETPNDMKDQDDLNAFDKIEKELSQYNQYVTSVSESVKQKSMRNGDSTQHQALTEEQAQEIFRKYHNKLLKSESTFGQSFFRRTEAKYNWSLAEILQHAKSFNNRSRAVCVKLGWLDNDAQLSENAPSVVKTHWPNTYNSRWDEVRSCSDELTI